MVCSKGNCWQVAQNAAGFPSDALIDDIRVSICIDNSIAPSNPLLTVSAQSRHAFACATCRVPCAACHMLPVSTCCVDRACCRRGCILKSAALGQRQVTKIKVAMPKLNLSCSRRKYCAILRILAAVSASSAQDASSDSAGQPKSEAAAASHPRPTSSSEAQQQETPPPNQRGAQQRSQHLSDWRLLDVAVHIAPKSSISLILWDEDAGAEGFGDHANPVPIAEMSIRNVTISYISFADESSTIEAGIGVIQGCVPHLLCPPPAEKIECLCWHDVSSNL
jgi:hypothetical protein